MILNLLKWQFQASRRVKSWRATIHTQRDEIDLLLQTSPSLRPRLEAFMASAYPKARRSAADETGQAVDVFPADCPYSPAQVLDPEWWPDEPAAG